MKRFVPIVALAALVAAPLHAAPTAEQQAEMKTQRRSVAGRSGRRSTCRR